MSPQITQVVQVGVFGDWPVPVNEGLRQIPAPVGQLCTLCVEAVLPGDVGAVMASHLHHRECAYRQITGGIGIYVNYDRYVLGAGVLGEDLLGADAGLTIRESALLVWRHLVDRLPVSEAELEALR